MRYISSMTREKQEEAVWLTAYVRALHTLDPTEAELVAIDALCRFRTRWIGVSAPPGIDPRVYAMARSAGERIDSEEEARLVREGAAEEPLMIS